LKVMVSLPSALAIGCMPVSLRSMIARRRWPKPMRRSGEIHSPLPSGPRAAM